MDNEHTQSNQNPNWLDEMLGTSTPSEEITADEMAVAAAKLTHPDDLELERILSEDWSDPDMSMFYATEEAGETPAKDSPAPAPRDPVATQDSADDDSDDFGDDIPDDDRPVRKGRPKPKKGYGLLGIPHILATFIWIAIIIAIGVSFGRLAWVCVADIMAFGKEPVSATITIEETDTFDMICTKLGDAGLVRYPQLFKQFATLTGKDAYVDPGTYTLSSQLDYNAMINGMVNYGPSREVVELMFPEGYNCAQIFAMLEENNVCSAKDLEQWAANGELDDYWFLDGVARGDKYCLEGYLAPDTYEFYTNDEPRRVLEKFLNEFDDRFSEKMEKQFTEMQQRYANMLASHGYGSSYIAANKLTLHQVLTLASIVQKETSSASESYTIASVFYNRLANAAEHPYLGSDATVYYAIGDYFGEKDELTTADLETDSPYNTRNHKGLPPGPICNPGAESVYAALDPNDTKYYYFVYSSVERKHLFARTYSEFLSILDDLGL